MKLKLADRSHFLKNKPLRYWVYAISLGSGLFSAGAVAYLVYFQRPALDRFFGYMNLDLASTKQRKEEQLLKKESYKRYIEEKKKLDENYQEETRKRLERILKVQEAGLLPKPTTTTTTTTTSQK